jgi:hypothetical protein
VSWDTVSPGYRPLSWGYPGILRMPPVSHDANLRFQTIPYTPQTETAHVTRSHTGLRRRAVSPTHGAADARGPCNELFSGVAHTRYA